MDITQMTNETQSADYWRGYGDATREITEAMKSAPEQSETINIFKKLHNKAQQLFGVKAIEAIAELAMQSGFYEIPLTDQQAEYLLEELLLIEQAAERR
jgi:hypothetical protein